MFSNKIFSISILFSLIWHVFWIFAVGIAAAPTVESSDLYQEVSFLGPILEKTAFDIMAEGGIPHSETVYTSSSTLVTNAYLRVAGPARRVKKEVMPENVLDRFFVVLRGYFSNKKEVPSYVAESAEMRYSKKRKTKAISFIDGPAKQRELISKPEPASVPRGVYSNEKAHIVKLKFFVSKDGIVRDIEPVVSSGYPEIDLLAVKSLKKWRFSPTNVKQKHKPIWGVTSIRIETK